MHLSLENSYNGGRKIGFKRIVICAKGKMTDSANPNAKTIYYKCETTIRRIILQRLGPMILKTQTSWDECTEK